ALAEDLRALRGVGHLTVELHRGVRPDVTRDRRGVPATAAAVTAAGRAVAAVVAPAAGENDTRRDEGSGEETNVGSGGHAKALRGRRLGSIHSSRRWVTVRNPDGNARRILSRILGRGRRGKTSA